MIDETAAAIATGAAGNVVAYMLNGRADALREWCVRVFRHGTPHDQSEALEAVDDDASALTERRTSEAAVMARWTALLAAHLESHPEAVQDIGNLGPALRAIRVSVVGSQVNSGPGVFIAGDNHGGINLGREQGSP